MVTRMFIRIKTSNNSPRKSVQICESYRVGKSVRQKVLRHVGVAYDDAHLLKLKNLAKYLMEQLQKERTGPTLFELSPQEIPPQEQRVAFSVPSDEFHPPKLPVDLANLKEEKRLVEGFHNVFERLFQELGFHQFLSKRPSRILLDTIIARIAS